LLYRWPTAKFLRDFYIDYWTTYCPGYNCTQSPLYVYVQYYNFKQLFYYIYPILVVDFNLKKEFIHSSVKYWFNHFIWKLVKWVIGHHCTVYRLFVEHCAGLGFIPQIPLQLLMTFISRKANLGNFSSCPRIHF